MSDFRTKKLASQKRSVSNRGFVLIAVLVCLSVIGAIMFSAMMTSLRHRRQLDRELQMEQTRWLAEAGIGKAIATIDGNVKSDDESVFEETYQPELDQYPDAAVTIKSSSDRSRGVTVVEVVSSIGDPERPELLTRHRVRREFKFDTKEKNDQKE